ncbi:cysteine proteinase inhibitor 12 [Gossypium raimondii]|uniref:Cysteine proteinase inhibitor n=1 Tax=Gossypium raimondii TaxID=29730 RepID=A0A0D2SWS3_GOSRA|nr:cysteine proteinase inhibitor 12 [Gossypium raimondii]KJB67858.1 hypothetical protein B456_010G215300 [Gossypium raimondii]
MRISYNHDELHLGQEPKEKNSYSVRINYSFEPSPFSSSTPISILFFINLSAELTLSLEPMTTTTAVTLGGGSAINVELENVACFAIDEHNNREDGTVVFVRVDQAAEPLVVGRLHHLTVEAIDAGGKKLYEAKVWVKPWSNFKQLQEFKHAGDAHASPSSTTSDLVVNKVVQPLPGTGRSSYAKKRRAKRMGSDYYSFARWKTKDGHGPGLQCIPTHDPLVE